MSQAPSIRAVRMVSAQGHSGPASSGARNSAPPKPIIASAWTASHARCHFANVSVRGGSSPETRSYAANSTAVSSGTST